MRESVGTISALIAFWANAPWIIITFWAIDMVRNSATPIAGEIWFLPMSFWVCSIPFIIVPILIALIPSRFNQPTLAGRIIAGLAAIVLISGPVTALIYCAITGKL